MKSFLCCISVASILLCGCHESIEQRACREAREYTDKYCPTPVQNYMRTDSVVFDIPSRTYHYYCSVMDELDDPRVFELNKGQVDASLKTSVNDNTNFRSYKNEKFNFAWTLRSGKNPRVVLYEKTITPRDY